MTDEQKIKDAYDYLKCLKHNPKDITISWDGGKTWYRDGKEIKDV